MNYEPFYGEHRNVVFLAECASRLHNRLGIGKTCEERRQSAESVEFATSRTRFEYAVRMQRQAIAVTQRKMLVAVFGFVINAQRKGRIKSHFAFVKKRRQVTSVGKRAMTESLNLERERSGEAALHASDQATVKPHEHLRGMAVELSQCAYRADHESYRSSPPSVPLPLTSPNDNQL